MLEQRNPTELSSREQARREKISQAQKQHWANPETHRRRSGKPRSRAVRRKISRGQKRVWAEADPEARRQRIETMKEAVRTPEVRQKRSEATIRAMAKPGVRAQKAEATRQQWKDKKIRKRMVAGIRSAPAREGKSRAMRGRWNDPEKRKALVSSINAAMTPEVLKRRGSALSAHLKTRKGRRQLRNAANRTWEDPRIAERRKSGMLRHHAEQKQKLAELDRLKARQVGRPPTRMKNAQYLPRLRELKAQNKTLSQITMIMNRETGDNRTSSGWRHILEDSPALQP